MLLLHTPNWRKLEDIKQNNQTWEQLMSDFLKSDDCPIFVKADIERAKTNYSEEEHDIKENHQQDEGDTIEQPEWAQLLEPHKEYYF